MAAVTPVESVEVGGAQQQQPPVCSSTSSQAGPRGSRRSQEALQRPVSQMNSNPNSADQLGLDILAGFRRKMFGTLLIQSVLVLGVSWGWANIPAIKEMEIAYHGSNFDRDLGILSVLLLATLIALGFTAKNRYKHPKNLIYLAAFSIFLSIFLGSFIGSNVHLCLGLCCVGVLLIAIPSCIKFNDKMIEVFPVSFFVVLITIIIGITWEITYNDFIYMHWTILSLVFSSLALLWFGWEIDRLCSTVEVDEFLLPVVILWCEFVVMLIVLLSFAAVANGATQCGDCLVGCSYTTCHCDCFIHRDGRRGTRDFMRDRRNQMEAAREAELQERMEEMRREPGDVEAQQAPAPQVMGNAESAQQEASPPSGQNPPANAPQENSGPAAAW